MAVSWYSHFAARPRRRSEQTLHHRRLAVATRADPRCSSVEARWRPCFAAARIAGLGGSLGSLVSPSPANAVAAYFARCATLSSSERVFAARDGFSTIALSMRETIQPWPLRQL